MKTWRRPGGGNPDDGRLRPSGPPRVDAPTETRSASPTVTGAPATVWLGRPRRRRRACSVGVREGTHERGLEALRHRDAHFGGKSGGERFGIDGPVGRFDSLRRVGLLEVPGFGRASNRASLGFGLAASPTGIAGESLESEGKPKGATSPVTAATLWSSHGLSVGKPLRWRLLSTRTSLLASGGRGPTARGVRHPVNAPARAR